jgi:hypothetical protein
MAMARTAAFGGRAADELLLAISNDSSSARGDTHLGVFGKRAHVIAGRLGMAFTEDRTATAYHWREIHTIKLRRGSVIVQTADGKERAFRLVVDDVEEPMLSATFCKVLEEMRSGTFTQHGTAWHEHQNAIERLEGEFSDQDDAVLPLAAAGLWLAIGLMCIFLVAALVNAAAARAIPAGAFSLAHRIGPLDPRTVIAGFAFAALITTVVLRFALGRHAIVWARGAARGWHRTDSTPRRFAVRQLGRLLLASSSSAAIVLLAFLTFWPNIAMTVLVDQEGVRNEILFPFISIEEQWRDVTEIGRVDAGDAATRAVRIRFADGRELSTVGQDLSGGTEGQFFEVTTAWRSAAR